mmetsp:Transcript_136979/g.381885  ORF Transcript_136979/g.381885 Transcript_136979/m.381885 type:complete len:209 (+) Transcript_136979:56-682(+)
MVRSTAAVACLMRLVLRPLCADGAVTCSDDRVVLVQDWVQVEPQPSELTAPLGPAASAFSLQHTGEWVTGTNSSASTCTEDESKVVERYFLMLITNLTNPTSGSDPVPVPSSPFCDVFNETLYNGSRDVSDHGLVEQCLQDVTHISGTCASCMREPLGHLWSNCSIGEYIFGCRTACKPPAHACLASDACSLFYGCVKTSIRMSVVCR